MRTLRAIRGESKLVVVGLTESEDAISPLVAEAFAERLSVPDAYPSAADRREIVEKMMMSNETGSQFSTR
jgi:hypothetical protein